MVGTRFPEDYRAAGPLTPAAAALNETELDALVVEWLREEAEREKFRADHLSDSGDYSSMPTSPLSSPAARAVAAEAARLVSLGSPGSAGGGAAAAGPSVRAALRLVARAAPGALEDKRLLFKLKRHEVIANLRDAAAFAAAAAANSRMLRHKEKAKAKAKANEKAGGAEEETKALEEAKTAAALAAAAADQLASVRASKAEALRVLREELAPLALEAEPDSYEVFRSTLLLLNEVKDEAAAVSDGEEEEEEEEGSEKGKGNEEDEEGTERGGNDTDDDDDDDTDDDEREEAAHAAASAAALNAGTMAEPRVLPPPPPPPRLPPPLSHARGPEERRSRFEPPPTPPPPPADAPRSALDAAAALQAPLAGLLRRTLLASLGVRGGPPRLEAALRYLCLAAVSGHESRLEAAVDFVRRIEGMEEEEARLAGIEARRLRQEAAAEAAAAPSNGGGGGGGSTRSGPRGGAIISQRWSLLPSSALVVSLLGGVASGDDENGRDAPPLEDPVGPSPSMLQQLTSSSSAPLRPGDAGVQAFREALRLLSGDEARRRLAAAGFDAEAAVRSELAAWDGDGGRAAIGALAREYAAARGLSGVSGGGGGGGAGGSGSDDDDGGGGGGDLSKKKKKASSPPKKSSPSSEAKEAVEQQGGDANLLGSPPRKARRRRRHGSNEEAGGDDEGDAGEGSGVDKEKAVTANHDYFSSVAAGHARIRELLSLALQGRAAEVEAAVEAASPGLLRSRPAAAFDLRAARLRHLASKGDARAALAEARAALSPLADACPELLLPRLKETMSGLLPGAAGGAGGGGGSGAAPSSSPPPPELDDLRRALVEALAVPEPRLGLLLVELLRVHEAWFAAQRCRDALEGAVGLQALRAPGWDPWASLPPARASAATTAAAATAAATAVRGAAGNSENPAVRALGDRAAARTALDWTHSAGWHAIAGLRGQALVLGGSGGGSGSGGGGGAPPSSRGGLVPRPQTLRASNNNRRLPVERDDDGENGEDGDHFDEESDEDGGGPPETNDTYRDDEDDDEELEELAGVDDDSEAEEELMARDEAAAAVARAEAVARARAALRALPPPDEDVVMVMEFTGMGRAAALELLARHGGSPQAAVQSLYS